MCETHRVKSERNRAYIRLKVCAEAHIAGYPRADSLQLTSRLSLSREAGNDDLLYVHDIIRLSIMTTQNEDVSCATHKAQQNTSPRYKTQCLIQHLRRKKTQKNNLSQFTIMHRQAHLSLSRDACAPISIV